MEFKKTLRRVTTWAATVAAAGAMIITAGTGTATANTGETEAPVTALANYTINNANTGRCLTANQLVGQLNSVFTNTCVGAVSQKWYIAGGKFVNIGTGQCLDYDGNTIVTAPCWADSDPWAQYQRWTTDATVKKWIRHAVYTGACMHSWGGIQEYVTARACSDSSRWTFAVA